MEIHALRERSLRLCSSCILIASNKASGSEAADGVRMDEYNTVLAPLLKLPDSLRICQEAAGCGSSDFRFTIPDIAASNWQSLA